MPVNTAYFGRLHCILLLFMNIMESLVSDIFDPFVFNNITADSFNFCPPRVFSAPFSPWINNSFSINNIHL